MSVDWNSYTRLRVPVVLPANPVGDDEARAGGNEHDRQVLVMRVPRKHIQHLPGAHADKEGLRPIQMQRGACTLWRCVRVRKKNVSRYCPRRLLAGHTRTHTPERGRKALKKTA